MADLPLREGDTKERIRSDWTRLLVDGSIELIPEHAFQFAPPQHSFGAGTLVFLPHIAGKSLSAQVEAAAHLKSRGFTPVAHLSARNFKSLEEFDLHVAALSDAGVMHCLAIGGVPSVTPNAVMEDAAEMIERPSFKGANFATVFVAGHPEGITGVTDAVLHASLLRKIEVLQAQGRSVEIATQFAFDGAAMARWARELHARGIDVPIRFGVAGVTSLPKLIKFAMLCGVGASINVIKQRASSVFKVLRDQDPQDVVEALAKGLQGVEKPHVRIHFFPFGGWEKTSSWLASKLDEKP